MKLLVLFLEHLHQRLHYVLARLVGLAYLLRTPEYLFHLGAFPEVTTVSVRIFPLCQIYVPTNGKDEFEF